MLLDLPAECVLKILKEIPVADVILVGCSCSGADSHLHGQQHTHYLLSTMHCSLLHWLHCAVGFLCYIKRQ
jgi:hypothetical protein